MQRALADDVLSSIPRGVGRRILEGKYSEFVSGHVPDLLDHSPCTDAMRGTWLTVSTICDYLLLLLQCSLKQFRLEVSMACGVSSCNGSKAIRGRRRVEHALHVCHLVPMGEATGERSIVVRGR